MRPHFRIRISSPITYRINSHAISGITLLSCICSVWSDRFIFHGYMSGYSTGERFMLRCGYVLSNTYLNMCIASRDNIRQYISSILSSPVGVLIKSVPRADTY